MRGPTSELERRLRAEHGGAMVETAISMLVIVPIIFYSLFLDDLLRYKLDLQETAVQSVWNFTVRDYHEGGDHAANVHWQDQMQYCNHTSAFDSYDADRDCDNEEHHKSMAAHQCWFYPNQSDTGQIWCAMVDEDLTSDYPDLTGIATGLAGLANKGGLWRCWARTSVVNSFMPQELFSEFSDVRLSEKERYDSDNPHSNASGDVFIFPYDRAALLTDTWALNDATDYDPNNEGSDDFYERVDNVFRGGITYFIFKALSLVFLANAWANDLLFPGLGFVFGDDPAVPNLSVKHGSPGSPPDAHTVSENGSNSDYWATPWDGFGSGDTSDKYKKTWDARGEYYMGCKQAEDC